MIIRVVALAEAEAEGCDGLAYKDEHTGDGIRRMQFVVANHALR